MNQALIIDEPRGDGWRFSLDSTAPTSAYQESRTFARDAAGHPFVDGKDYLLFAYHPESDQRLTDSATFWEGPTDYVLRPDSELADLAQITRRGAITIRTLTVGGIQSATWPQVRSALEVFVTLPQSNGTIRLARLTLADLAELLAPHFNLGAVAELPAYVPVRIWRWVIDTTTDELPAYVPVRIWRFVPDTVLTRPAAPSNLELVNDGGRWKLKYRDNSDNEASFRVVRKTGDGAFQPYVSIPANETLSGYLPDIDTVSTYTLKVQAVNGAGESAFSNEVVLSPPTPVPTRPAAPSNLELVKDGERWKLKYRDNSDNEASFRVVRKTGDGAYQPYLTLSANETLSGYLADIDTVSTYTLKVQAVNGAGESAFSNEVVLRPPAPPARVITAIRARIVSLGGASKRLEVEAISTRTIQVGFRFYDQAGAIGGYYEPFTTEFGRQTFTVQYDSNVPGQVPDYTSVEVRQVDDYDQHYGPCGLSIASLNGAWQTLLPI